MRRRPGLVAWALPAALAALLAADTAAWWVLTGRLLAQAAAWQQARSAAGYVVAADPARRAGWPLRAEVVLPSMTVATDTPGEADALAWHADAVRLVYAPWRPGVASLALEGAQTVQLGAAPPVMLTAEQLDVAIGLPGSPDPDAVTLSARSVRLPLASGEAGLDRVLVHLRGDDMQLSISGLRLPGPALPFGGAVAWLELQARSTVPLPALREPRAALAAWRDAGGRLQLDGMSLRWGKLDASGHATVGLDGAMQPEGTGLIRLTGFAEAVDALVRAGTITRNDGRVVTTLLGLLSTMGQDGSPQADLPVSLRNRVLSTGAVPLLRLPPLSVP